MMSLARTLRVVPPCAHLLTGTMILTLAVSCEGTTDEVEPVVVSVLSPYSGELGPVGPLLENAARFAEEQVNAAGGLFDGRPLELVFEDTETSASIGRDLAIRAVDTGSAAIIGPAISSGALAAAAVTQNAQVPQLSCCATSPLLSTAQLANDRWFFRTPPDDSQQAQAIAYLMDEGYVGDNEFVAPCDVGAVIYRDDDYGAQFAPLLAEAYEARGGAMPDALRIAYTPGQSAAELPDIAAAAVNTFATELETIPEDQRVCVVFISYSTDGIEIVRRLESLFANSARSGEHLLIGTDGTKDNDFASAVAGVNIIGTAPTHASSGIAGDAYIDFKTAYAARFNNYDEPPNFSWNMYDAVILAAAGIAKSQLESGEALRDAMRETSNDGEIYPGGAFFGAIADALYNSRNIDYVGPSGVLDFDENGDVVGDFLLWRVSGTTTISSGELRNTDFRF